MEFPPAGTAQPPHTMPRTNRASFISRRYIGSPALAQAGTHAVIASLCSTVDQIQQSPQDHLIAGADRPLGEDRVAAIRVSDEAARFLDNHNSGRHVPGLLI